jgi:hypothetical protein
MVLGLFSKLKCELKRSRNISFFARDSAPKYFWGLDFLQ